MIVSVLAAAALQAAQPAPPASAPAQAEAPPAVQAKAHDPDKMICRTEREIGTLFSHRVCVHKSVIDERRLNDRDILDKNQRGPLIGGG